MLAGGGTAGTQPGFDGSGTAIVKLETFQIAGQSRRHFLKQTDLDLSGKVVAVHQLFGIFSHSFGDLGVAMTEGGHIDTAGKVDVLVAVGVFHHTSLSLFKGNGEKADLTGKSPVIFSSAAVERFALGSGDLRSHQTGDLSQIKLIGCGIVFAHDKIPFFIKSGVILRN